jgi:hypothetical protein
LVSAFNDSTVNIWEVGTSRKTALASTVMESRVYWVTAHPTEHRIAIHAGGIKLWDFMAQDRSVQVTTHTTPVRSVEFSPNGRWIAAGSHPRRLGEKTGSPASVVVLDAESGKPINTIGSRIWGFDWLSDSRSLVVSPADGKHNLEVCNAFTGQTLKQFSGHADRAWPYVTGGGRTLISVAQDFAVRTWDIESGELKSEYNFKPHAKHRLEARLFDFDVSPQGRKLVVAFSNLWGMGIWDNRTESRTYLSKPPWEYVILLFTADESRLYVGGPGGELTLYDIATEKELNRFTGHTASVIALALSLDEKQIVSSDSAGRVIIWDAASAMPLVTLVGLHPDGVEHNAVVNSLDWSSDNTRIVAGKSDGTVQIWTLSAVSR